MLQKPPLFHWFGIYPEITLKKQNISLRSDVCTGISQMLSCFCFLVTEIVYATTENKTKAQKHITYDNGNLTIYQRVQRSTA